MLLESTKISTSKRLPVAMVGAGVVTLGLLSLMGFMIRVEEVEVAKPTQAPVFDINPKIIETITRTTEREVAPLSDVEIPPRQVYETNNLPDVEIPELFIPTSAPDLPQGGMMDFTPAPVAVDRVLQVVRPPMPVYPRTERSGVCEVNFDLSPQGRPFNVEAECDHTIFERAAARAVSRAEFMPEVINGQAVVRRNVVFPITFERE